MVFLIYFVIGASLTVRPPDEPAAFMMDLDDPVPIDMIRRTPKGHVAGCPVTCATDLLQLATGAGIVPLDRVGAGRQFQVRRSTLREVNRITVARLGESSPGIPALYKGMDLPIGTMKLLCPASGAMRRQF